MSFSSENEFFKISTHRFYHKEKVELQWKELCMKHMPLPFTHSKSFIKLTHCAHQPILRKTTT